jgi:hypothetical protein
MRDYFIFIIIFKLILYQIQYPISEKNNLIKLRRFIL